MKIQNVVTSGQEMNSLYFFQRYLQTVQLQNMN